MRIHGHDAQMRALIAAAAADRMHHAWLLAGPAGVGKASFADAAAAWLLADAVAPWGASQGFDVPAGHPTLPLIAAGSHPDLRRLERLAKDGAGEERARNITIAQLRALQPLFATTPSFSPRRVVVIDAIDDLERGAANALLKNLEEPPAGTVFLLVSHAPGRLLPTIRSRCRLLRFSRLDDDAMTAALAATLPEGEATERAALVRAGGGAPGDALALAGLDIAALDGALERLATRGDPTNAMRSALARQLSAKAAQPRYEAFLKRAPARLAAAARSATGARLADALAAWEEARDLAGAAVPLSLDPQATVFALAGLVARLAPDAAPSKA